MNIKKSIASFLGGGALLAVAYTVAHAICLNCVPVGTTMQCGATKFQCDASITTSTGPATFTTFVAGPNLPTFKVVATGTAPSRAELQPVGWSGAGTSPTLGLVNWGFAVGPGFSVPNTTITSMSMVADFPASAHIIAYVRGTIAAYPGVTFVSQTPLDFAGTVNSYAPFVNEIFTLAAPVIFVDQANPTTGPSFTMNTLTLQLNG